MPSYQKSVDSAANAIINRIKREMQMSLSEAVKAFFPKDHLETIKRAALDILRQLSLRFPELQDINDSYFALLLSALDDSGRWDTETLSKLRDKLNGVEEHE